MNGIEEIRKRNERHKELKNTNRKDSTSDDIEYLLSKLEIAETELRKIIYSKLANHKVTPEEIIKMADEALHQIRK